MDDHLDELREEMEKAFRDVFGESVPEGLIESRLELFDRVLNQMTLRPHADIEKDIEYAKQQGNEALFVERAELLQEVRELLDGRDEEQTGILMGMLWVVAFADVLEFSDASFTRFISGFVQGVSYQMVATGSMSPSAQETMSIVAAMITRVDMNLDRFSRMSRLLYTLRN